MAFKIEDKPALVPVVVLPPPAPPGPVTVTLPGKADTVKITVSVVDDDEEDKPGADEKP